MANYTTYINLEKPITSEYYAISVANSNNDIIDGQIGAINALLVDGVGAKVYIQDTEPSPAVDGDIWFKTSTLTIYFYYAFTDTWVNALAGEKGVDGNSVVSAAFVGNDIVFTLSDTSTVTLTDAKLELKGDTGSSGVQVSDEEPIDPEITVWIDTDENPDDLQSQIDAKANSSDVYTKIELDNKPKSYFERPAIYEIKVNSGRFNMSWTNSSGRLWIFPSGTVLYSDGTTPIYTSTAQQPDVIIPSNNSVVYLASATWNGAYQLLGNGTNSILISNLKDLPHLTYSLNLSNCSLVTGDLSDLPLLTYTLHLSICSLVP